MGTEKVSVQCFFKYINIYTHTYHDLVEQNRNLPKSM